jgi:uncharacterized protein YacL
MVLVVLRALFVLLMAAAGWAFLGIHWLVMAVALCVAIFFVSVDILAPRKKLTVFAGTFFGLLVGSAITYGLSFVVPLIVDQAAGLIGKPLTADERGNIIQFSNVLVSIICCYLAISFILQTKDDFRFIIPYVEFSRQLKGARPILLDTSVLIDGRVADVVGTGVLESQLIVPRFVLDELQSIADSGDRLKRNRGRRGLDVLAKMRDDKHADVVIYTEHAGHPDRERADEESADAMGVDQRLVELARELNGRVLTHDYNLNKVAQLRGVDVINLNDLATALKPVVLPGERMAVKIVKPGEAAGQGVGYLEDGTMVVVEQARPHLNESIEFIVTNSVQTSAGRMIFGRLSNDPTTTPLADAVRATPVRARSRPDRQSTSS